MEHFRYKGGCDIRECMCIKLFKEELAWAKDKWLWVISNANVNETVIATTKTPKNQPF